MQHYIATGPTTTVEGATGPVAVSSQDGHTVTLSGAGDHVVFSYSGGRSSDVQLEVDRPLRSF